MHKVEVILRKNTVNLFNDDWYSKTVNDILNLEKEQFGYVYFIRNGDSKIVKIGKSFDLNKRLLSFKTLMPDGVYLDGFIYSKTFDNIEKELHLRLKKFCKKGEWFEISQNELIHTLSDYDFTLVKGFVEKNSSVIEGVSFNFLSSNLSHVLEKKFEPLSEYCYTLEKNKKYCKKNFYEKVIPILNLKYEVSKKRINLILKKWCAINNISYISGNTNGMQWFILS